MGGLSIQQKRLKLGETLREAFKDLRELQNNCNHPNAVEKTFREETPYREFCCPDCGKHWNTTLKTELR